MQKIILVGGSGFIGKSLLPKLVKEKFQVKTMIHNNDLDIEIQTFKGDILSPGMLDSEISRGDIVINLIGQTTSNVGNLVELNIMGGLNLLDSCIKKKAKEIILISSINVYGENMKTPSKEIDPLKPETTYGIVKMMAEKIYEYYSKTYDLNITILRLSHVYGPRKKAGIVSNLMTSIKNKKSVTLYDKGKQSRDLLYIDDATDGIIQAIKTHRSGFNIFNISSGKKYMIKDLVKTIEKITHKKLNVKLDAKIQDERCIWADNSKAQKLIKFKPQIDIEKGLKLTIENLMKIN
ncbi:MAG TPA: NAD-dependent epimerase/dehydratase family protein [Nitrosopumilaceae archaeon]|nr:NAD-dependent epimerase/dehydratase family protein [Nitrosopumilaceae archaeon]